jgi:formamidopyrimidine-DNA glycosylase
MPELPEVETMRRNIASALTGATVERYELTLPKLLRTSPIPTLDSIIGKKLIAVRRRAKVLMIDFDGDLTLAMHAKLAGQITIIRPDESRLVAGHPHPSPTGDFPANTTHLTIWFEDGSRFYYSDIRQFGWFRLAPTEEIQALVDAMAFGPEGIGENPVDVEALRRGLARRRIPVKLALLDQKLLAGLGNIYVDEALHRAKIHPSTPANEVPEEKLPALLDAIQWALTEGLRQGGAKIINGKAHPVDNFPEVHGREGEPCPVCGTTIIKVRVGQRGTYLCPNCQPLPEGVKPPASMVRTAVEDPEEE